MSPIGLTTTTVTVAGDFELNSDYRQIRQVFCDTALEEAFVVTLPAAVENVGREISVGISRGEGPVTVEADGCEVLTPQGGTVELGHGKTFSAVSATSDGENWIVT